MRTTILAALSAAAVLVVAACGSAGAASSPTLGGGATLAPRDSSAFVALDTTMSSGQWDALDSVLDEFPSRDKLVAQAKVDFAKSTKLRGEDAEPLLGDEVDVVILPGAEHEYVVLTRSPDAAKLAALVRRSGDVSKQLGDWTAIADSADALAALPGTAGSLADNPVYKAATAKLAEDALVHAYANG